MAEASLGLDFFISLLPAALVGSLALLVSSEIRREGVGYSRLVLISFLATYSVPTAFSLLNITIPYSIHVVNLAVWMLLIKLIARVSLTHSIVFGLMGYGINVALFYLGVTGWVAAFFDRLF